MTAARDTLWETPMERHMTPDAQAIYEEGAGPTDREPWRRR